MQPVNRSATRYQSSNPSMLAWHSALENRDRIFKIYHGCFNNYNNGGSTTAAAEGMHQYTTTQLIEKVFPNEAELNVVQNGI